MMKGLLKGNARLYKLSKPLKYDRYDFEKEEDVPESTDYVIVSAIDAMFSGPETYIFAADSEGRVLDWGELEGSYRGGYDHEQALADAGYTVVEG